MRMKFGFHYQNMTDSDWVSCYNCNTKFYKRGGPMQTTPVQTYKRINVKNDTKRPVWAIRLERSDLARAVFSFLLGRCQIMYMMTPFLLSYYAAEYKKEKSAIHIIFSMLGVLTLGSGIGSLKYMIAMLIYSIYRYTFGDAKEDDRPRLNLAVCGLSSFAGGIFFIALDGFAIYDTLLLLLESGISVLGMAAIRHAYPLILSFVSRRKEKRIVLNSELVCACLFLTAGILGIWDWAQISGYNIVNTIVLFAVIAFSYSQGMTLGCLCGAVCGAMVGIRSGSLLSAIGMFSFCGLIAGKLGQYGKLAAAAGCILAALASALYGGSVNSIYLNLYEIAAAAGAFLMVPSQYMKNNTRVFENGVDSVRESDDQKHMREHLIDKLERTSKSFSKLSSTFDEITQRQLKGYSGGSDSIFNSLGEQICKNCAMFHCCWERDFAATYQNVTQMVHKLEEKGYVDIMDLDEKFREHCTQSEEMVLRANHLFELCKLDARWANDLSQNRRLLSQQYKGISKIMDGMADQVRQDITFSRDLKNKIIAQLQKAHFRIREASVVEIGEDRYEVDLALKAEHGVKEIGCEIAMHVSCVLGRPMVICDEAVIRGIYHVKLAESDRFEVRTGLAVAKQNGSSACGDSFAAVKLSDGRFMLALSDGMGSGRKAAAESGATVTLLEQFLDSGFDRETALGLINSVLVLQSAEESFATIDLGIINLISGVCEFVKIGSAAGFIKRGDSVEVIPSTSLPAGILSQIDPELSAKPLHDGDLIIMMSDGVLESNKNHSVGEEWVLEFLQKHRHIMDPQTMADQLLEAAKMNQGQLVSDDMTVAVARILKKVS